MFTDVASQSANPVLCACWKTRFSTVQAGVVTHFRLCYPHDNLIITVILVIAILVILFASIVFVMTTTTPTKTTTPRNLGF